MERAYVVNVDAAVVRDGEYLLIERAPEKDHAGGALAFPGGRVEQSPGGRDALEATAARELYEEVGLEAGTVEYVCSSTFESDGGTRCINVVTLCRDVEGSPHRNAPREVAAVHWLSPAELRAHDDAPPFLEEYVRRVERYRSAEATHAHAITVDDTEGGLDEVGDDTGGGLDEVGDDTEGGSEEGP